MKHLIITSFIFSSLAAFSQTNTFPSSGNVGIGTTSPAEKLSVIGVTSSEGLRIPGRFSFGQSNSAIEIEVPTGSYNAIRGYNGSQHLGTIHFFDDTWGGGSASNSAGAINLSPITAVTIGAWNNPVAYFGNNGNIGIGTTAPGAKLEIYAPGDGNNILKLGTERPWVFLQQGTGAGASMVFRSLAGGKYFRIQEWDGEDVFTIRSSTGDSYFKGNMGIGTPNPDYKLTVKGKIHAEEVKVDLSVPGPDYVFEPGYELSSLEDLKTYIREHKHLPGIPSAEEMEKNGINLMEMNVLLLKKVEELTLYLIESHRENELFKAKMEVMQKQIDELKQKMP